MKGLLVWLFSPPKDMKTFAASAYAPASEDLTLDCILRCPDIELCALSSETVSPRPLSWRGWRTRPWLRLLCGTICDPSTAERGVAKFISSLPAIHASPSPFPVFELGTAILATFGRMSGGSSRRPSPQSASSRTFPDISPLVFQTSSETFSAWATELQRASYLRRKSAGRIPAKGSSYWPTPTFKGSGNRACIRMSPAGLQFCTDQNQTGSQVGIKNAASAWTLMWDLMVAAGWKPGRRTFSQRCRVILLNGEKHSEGALSLNPAFSDHLMGWLPGWSEPLQPVTGWSRWLQLARSSI